MKKNILTALIVISFISPAFSQGRIDTNERLFVKRIEQNAYGNRWNFDGKESLEKLFFGDFNAYVEFFCSEMAETSFRVLKKGLFYTLEIKYVTNAKEVDEAFEEKTKHYKVATRAVPINSQFAERLHKRMFFCIDNFKATKAPPNISRLVVDGYWVTFRVVTDEAVVWSLKIDNPSENDAEKMANLCLKIAADVRYNVFHESRSFESKYMDELKTNDLNIYNSVKQ